jgi:hypothetical protein
MPSTIRSALITTPPRVAVGWSGEKLSAIPKTL